MAVSHKRGAKGLTVAVLFCLVAVLVPGVASAHEPEAKTICPDGYTLSADETECAKPVVQDHGDAQCDSGYSLVAKTRGASACEKTVGSPTCAKGVRQGDDCMDTVGYAKCATGNHLLGSCIGKVGSPTCAKGVRQGDDCMDTVGYAKCATGNHLLGSCIGKVGSPTCATGTRLGSNCVDTVVTTASYRCGSGRLTSGYLGIPVCLHTASKSCPVGYRPLWGGCYHPVTYKTTLPSCPSGYSSSGSGCVR